uniref:Uncharacterized protein n=1 Tax=Panagrolaimus superbus TaxID=310955 RepID=A0A914YRL6_9BILA
MPIDNSDGDWMPEIQRNMPKNKSLVVTTSLYANNINQNMLSMFIKNKFYQCEAKYIEIDRQKLTEKEFDFLVGRGNVESCSLREVQILKDDGQSLLIEEIMAKMPKLTDFSSFFINVTNESLEKLQQLSFQNKLLNCQFQGVHNDTVTAQAFCDFIVKNYTPLSTFALCFARGVTTHLFIINLRISMQQLVNNQWKTAESKPKIIISPDESPVPLI